MQVIVRLNVSMMVQIVMLACRKVDGNCTDESTAGICQYPNENYCCRYTTIITAYYITYSAGSGGTVTNSGQNNVEPGGRISSTATPNSGYRFVKWS